MAVRISDIYRRVNIPTLLVLPVFAHQICKNPIHRARKPPVPLYMLMWEYGLVQSYIELEPRSVVPEPKSLIVKFTREVLADKKLTSSEFHSLNDRLVSSEFVFDVWTDIDHVYYMLPMATNIVDDVIKIMDSKFTEVSNFYKKAILTPVRKLPSWEHNLGHFIMQHNIPAAVLKRHETLKNLTEEELGVKVVSDLFRKFSFEFDVYRI